MKPIERALRPLLNKRLLEPSPLLQVLVGPRQVGKTTLVHQVEKVWGGPSFYASADLPAPPDAQWVQTQWQLARVRARETRKRTLLVLDEIQKVHRWGDVVKACVDEDRRHHSLVRTILLGSSSLHVQKGAQESLAGRFELHYCSHWTWSECQQAFKWDLNQWLYFGGYPGAAPFIKERERWADYVSNSLVEAVLSRDVLQLTTIVKPALLRQLFRLATRLPAQILSYTKMLGQLADAGNTTTLAHYLQLLSSAYLVSGLQQWSGGSARERASSPKLVFWNNALFTSSVGYPDLKATLASSDRWGRVVENAVGAHLLNHLPSGAVYYWRDGNDEVDYVVQYGDQTIAFEVKSGRERLAKGLSSFQKKYPQAKSFIIGTGGIPLDEFFKQHPKVWF